MTRKLAKKKIKNHLQRSGENSNFTVTPSLVLYWWRILNHAIFDGQLRLPGNVKVKKTWDCWAWCEGANYSKYAPVTYGFEEEYYDKEFFITCLAHEMVHHWEQQTFGRMSHGKNFFLWKEKFARLGLSLEKSYS